MAELAHELRNALHPLSCALHVLEQTAAADSVALRAVPIARRQVEHMSYLVEELLDVGRVVNGKLSLERRCLALRDLVGEVLQDFSLTCAERSTAFRLPAEPLWVDADGVRLRQVLSNVLHNAIKFTAPDGRIEVAVRAAGAWAEISVSDNGRGISPDRLEQVFELFKQERRDAAMHAPGLGIGLALARRLVEMHGGTIAAASAGHQLGTCFTIRLPLRGVAVVQPVGGGRGVRAQDVEAMFSSPAYAVFTAP